jgi:hypothetical protein
MPSTNFLLSCFDIGMIAQYTYIRLIDLSRYEPGKNINKATQKE